MTDKISPQQVALSAAILPAVVAGGDWDDYNPEFLCPLTHTNYFVVPFKGEYLDEGEEPWFRIDAMDGDTCTGHLRATDLDECKQIIASEIAADLIKAKRRLIEACTALGLDGMPRVGDPASELAKEPAEA